MKRINIILLFLSVCSLVLPSRLFAENVMNMMQKVDEIARNSSRSAVSNIRISTCKYKIENKRMKCSEKPRVVYIENLQKDYGPDMKDSRSLSIMIKPISDKGVGMLTYEYYAHDKDNDTWLYFPALGRVKRVVSSNDGSGNFFGSEFLNENMVIRKIEEYTYKIIEEKTYKNRPVWIVEIIPTEEKAKKLPFGKIVSWIDKERYIPLKENIYNHNNQLFLQQIWVRIDKIDGVWVAKKVSMNNFISRRVSHLENVSIKFHIEIPDEILTQRSLTDFAYREKNLENYRRYLE